MYFKNKCRKSTLNFIRIVLNMINFIAILSKFYAFPSFFFFFLQWRGEALNHSAQKKKELYLQNLSSHFETRKRISKSVFDVFLISKCN